MRAILASFVATCAFLIATNATPGADATHFSPAIRQLATSKPLVGSDFKFDGNTSDLARQFYVRYQAGDTVAKVTTTDVPDSVQARLDNAGAMDFAELPGLVQRALLWDTGYVLDPAEKIVKMWTLTGRSMADIFVSKEEYESAMCVAKFCPNTGTLGSQSYKSQFCTGTQMLSVTKCMSEDLVGGSDFEAVNLSMWSTGSDPNTSPEITIRYHAWTDGGVSYLVYAIHTAEDVAKYGNCPKANHYGAVVIPCYKKSDTTPDKASQMKEPATSAWLDTWLTAFPKKVSATTSEDRAAEESSTGSSSSNTSPPSRAPRTTVTPATVTPATVNPATVTPATVTPAKVTPATVIPATVTPATVTKPTDPKSLTLGVIVGIVGGAFLVLLILLIFILRKRHTKSDSNDDQVENNKDEDYRIGTDRTEGTGGSRMEWNQVRTSLRTGGSNGGRSSLWDDDAIFAARIPREKLFQEALISRGGYGEVYRGRYNGSTVAIKQLLPEARRNMSQINSLLAEVKLLVSLEHPRIIQFIGVAWDSPSDLCLVLEYMEGGDLRALLTMFEEVQHRKHGFDSDKLKIALHIAHALTYLHSLNPIVLHRDLKSKNILLDSKLDAKLTDFGVSRERSSHTMTAGVGTSLWIAPEVMLGERYDQKADVFSFGVVLSELDSHALPYSQVKQTNSGRHIPDTAVLQMVAMGRLSVQFSRNASHDMVALGKQCVAKDPHERPLAAEILYRLQRVSRGLGEQQSF
ncbi:Tkl/drk protein kinase, partial [Globisporangium splendens]